MKKMITYLTAFGYIFGQTIGRAAEAPSAFEVRSQYLNSREYARGLSEAYDRTGPQGFIDATRIKFEDKDRSFFIGLLQSQHQKFIKLPNVDLAKGGAGLDIKSSDGRVWNFKVVDRSKGVFALNGKIFHLNFKDTMRDNYRVVEDTVRSLAANPDPQPASAWLRFLNISALPQADAQDFLGLSMTTWIIIAVAIAGMFIAYNMGKSSGVTQGTAQGASDEKAALKAKWAEHKKATKSDTGSVSYDGSTNTTTDSLVKD